MSVLPVVGLPGEAVSAGLTLWAAGKEASALRDMGRQYGELGVLNAEFAELDAHNAEVFGFTQTARYDAVISEGVSSQRAEQAAKGTDVTFGTARALQEEIKLTGTLNTIAIEQQARDTAMGFKREARDIRINALFKTAEFEQRASAVETAAQVEAAKTVIDAIF